MAYWLRVYSIPQAGPASRGKAIINLLPRLEKGDKVASILPVESFEDDNFVVFATEQGIIKKTALSAFSHPKVTGIIAMKIQKGDRLLAARVTAGDQDIILGTADGKAIRFSEEEARPMGRNTQGVKGIALRKGDRVIGVDTVREDFATILTVTEHGFGKRTQVGQYKRQHRGGMGLIDIKTTKRNGHVVGQTIVSGEDEVILITHGGKVIRIPTAGVKVQGRNTQGVTIIDVGKDDHVVAVARLADAD
jgi:DNA gyrase subunit A